MPTLMKKGPRWTRGPVTLRQSYCHRGRRAFQSERYRISDLNRKVRAPALPSAWLASLVGTRVQLPDVRILAPKVVTLKTLRRSSPQRIAEAARSFGRQTEAKPKSTLEARGSHK